MKLRPVSFRYKTDPQGTIQYGLIAEEVERVYPELVTHGPDGKIQTVRYSMLNAMLLNELGKQTREEARQDKQLKKLSAQMAQENTNHQRERMQERLSALEQAMQTKNRDRTLAAAENR